MCIRAFGVLVWYANPTVNPIQSDWPLFLQTLTTKHHHQQTHTHKKKTPNKHHAIQRHPPSNRIANIRSSPIVTDRSILTDAQCARAHMASGGSPNNGTPTRSAQSHSYSHVTSHHNFFIHPHIAYIHTHNPFSFRRLPRKILKKRAVLNPCMNTKW
ncbi:hypothetical protein DM02DRAFT_408906 [Periconia macrospinosa]|uniref:Uncharacterized protein n=1 Tax=Periconia macrospinosa TaxID=97972 RepID=A0A2V1E8H2_9PLEO|nr:hypothetical protein DM02DRAFT_408906 [Periconia macrospinosa]